MPSSPEQPRGPRTGLEAVLRELGVERALAERILARLAGLAGLAPIDESSTRARVSHPPTRAHEGPLDPQVTLRARPGRLDGDFVETPVREPPASEAAQVLEDEAARDTAWSSAVLEPVLLLGEGGMGEVHRARDRALGRDLAMKVLHEHLATVPRMRGRFLDEAQITAQLSHPSIPPVHALGRLEDGRPFFTMKEVHGRTLAAVVDAGFEGPSAVSEQRRLEIFQRVCEAVAYAHARGVIHCDLKPLNVMVGAFGEVLVMDWGVARLVAPTVTSADEVPVQTSATNGESSEVAGTPAYMPPEQALADVARIGPPSDVYALGVMLFELLAGERPYQGALHQLLYLASQGEVPPLPRRPGSIIDDALQDIVRRAMRPDPSERFADAGALGEEVARWREGAMRREKAQAIVSSASEQLLAIGPNLVRAAALRAEAALLLAAVPPDAGPDARHAAWAKEDEARAITRDVDLRMAEAEQMLEAALVHAPELDEPKVLLADLAFERHQDAERRRAWDEAARHEVRLRAYDVGTYASYLAATARLTLATDVPARAELVRYELRDRRLVPTPVRDLGPTPLEGVLLPVGSYALVLRAVDRPPLTVPFALRRRRDCVFARPGGSGPTPIAIPEPGAISEDEVVIPSGWLCAGGDAMAWGSAPAEPTWIDAFVVQRDPVRFRDLGPFLASAAGGPHREAVLRGSLGAFHPDWPAVGLSWEAARAYAAWLAERTGRAWRLPAELEWEKAARGADARTYPWGDAEEASFAHVRSQGRAPSRPARVDAFPTDVSPYGVRGMAGNVREWCAEPFATVPSHGRPSSGLSTRRVVRGGSFRLPLEAARCAVRSGLPASSGFVDVGVRLVRSL